ncbi:MAG: universal stress protein [Dehalococcoidia bacterium]
MKVLIPVDSNGFPQQVLPNLRECIQRVASHVTLLLVDGDPPDVGERCAAAAIGRPLVLSPAGVVVTVLGRAAKARERELLEYLEGVAGQLEGAGARVQAVVRSGDPRTEIANEARAGAYDLIMMDVHEGISDRASDGARLRAGIAGGVSIRADDAGTGGLSARRRQAVAA